MPRDSNLLISGLRAWESRVIESVILEWQMEGRMEEVMRCTFLEENYLSCRAKKEVYVPSVLEFRQYCAGKQYQKCQVYFKTVMASWRFSKRPFKLLPPRIIGID
jgi:hypothetical protein